MKQKSCRLGFLFSHKKKTQTGSSFSIPKLGQEVADVPRPSELWAVQVGFIAPQDRRSDA